MENLNHIAEAQIAEKIAGGCTRETAVQTIFFHRATGVPINPPDANPTQVTEAEIAQKTQVGLSREQAIEVLIRQRALDGGQLQ